MTRCSSNEDDEGFTHLIECTAKTESVHRLVSRFQPGMPKDPKNHERIFPMCSFRCCRGCRGKTQTNSAKALI